MVRQVVGVGRSRKNLKDALRLGVIDKAETDVAHAVAGADLVLIGAPVGQMPGIFARIAPALPPHAVVTDAGSTKQDVIEAARKHLGAHFPMFVPAHPIAGTEHSGAAAAAVCCSWPGGAALVVVSARVLLPLPSWRWGAWRPCWWHPPSLPTRRC